MSIHVNGDIFGGSLGRRLGIQCALDFYLDSLAGCRGAEARKGGKAERRGGTG